MIRLLYYVGPGGSSPFETWFSGLDTAAAAKVTVAISRIEQGNLGHTKSVGEGVLEYRIDSGLWADYRQRRTKPGVTEGTSGIDAELQGFGTAPGRR